MDFLQLHGVNSKRATAWVRQHSPGCCLLKTRRTGDQRMIRVERLTETACSAQRFAESTMELLMAVFAVAAAGFPAHRLSGICGSHDLTSDPSEAANDIVPFSPSASS
jgi:hypothetical protein